MFREMLLMFGLMLLMFQMISCVDQTCRFNQTEICYAVLGHKLSLQMVLDPKLYDARIQHLITGDKAVDTTCLIKNNTMKNCDLYMNRSDVTISNGVVIINHVIREDSGRYRLILTDLIGSEKPVDLQVNVEAPIGSVNVSINCSSGERRVFCSSDGDELIFSWTLNGLPQTEGNDIFVLDDETSGNIGCGVKNHVSRGEKSINLNYCTGVDQTCRFNQTEICYAVLGHKLSLQMVLDPKLYDAKIQHLITGDKAVDPACRIINDIKKVNNCDLYMSRSDVTISNGSVIINHVIREDSGRYTLDLTDSISSEKTAELQGNVKDPLVVLIVLGCVTVILVVLFITVYLIYKRKKHHKSTAEHQTERKEKKDEELQYGEVTFTPDKTNSKQQQQQQQQQRCKEQDECVYSHIK